MVFDKHWLGLVGANLCVKNNQNIPKVVDVRPVFLSYYRKNLISTLPRSKKLAFDKYFG